MPCKDERDDPRWQAEEERKQFGDTKLNITTRIACEWLGRLEAAGGSIPDYAVRWWIHHKAQDQRGRSL